jgi:hypothetical protein
MAQWLILDYVELSGRNQIRDWLDRLPQGDQARINARLRQMALLPHWRNKDKWISKYQGTADIFEFRIKGTVQYRPLGTYYGERTYALLVGTVERNWRIPKRDVELAKSRLVNLRTGRAMLVPHVFDEDTDA